MRFYEFRARRASPDAGTRRAGPNLREGPARSGRTGRLKRALLEKLGLDDLSPKRRRLVVLVVLAEFGLLGLGFFTELPSSWLVTAALAILPLAFHQEKEETGEETDPGHETRTQDGG